jgi:hypothetical protein
MNITTPFAAKPCAPALKQYALADHTKLQSVPIALRLLVLVRC